MRHLFRLVGLTAFTLIACEPVNSGTKAWGTNGDGKEAAPALTQEALEAKRTAEDFIKALRERNAKNLLALSSVAKTFKLFLPENFDANGKEQTIADAAIQSEDKRLRKLAESSFFTIFSSDIPGKYLVVFAEASLPPNQSGALHTLEVEFSNAKYRVVQIGSNAFGDGGGKWINTNCSAFAAPFKVPASLSPKPTFEACEAALSSFKQQLSTKSPEAQKLLASYLEKQPFVEKKTEIIRQAAKQAYGLGEDQQAFQFGFSEGSLLRLQFILSMSSYCGCLPSEKGSPPK